MNCKWCTSEVKDFNGEVAIHFPGLESLDKPIVWVFPKLRVCLGCGFAEFVIPDEQLQQLRDGAVLAQSPGKPSSGDCVKRLAQLLASKEKRRSINRWQHRLKRERPTCTERTNIAHRECGWKGGDSGYSAGEKLV